MKKVIPDKRRATKLDVYVFITITYQHFCRRWKNNRKAMTKENENKNQFRWNERFSVQAIQVSL